MVTANPELKPAKGKRGPKKGFANVHPRAQLTPADQAVVRTRYLVRGERPIDIAKACNLPVGPIRDLVARRGWTTLRAGQWAKKEAETVAAMNADVERVMHEAAFTSEELLTGSGELARNVLQSKDCKGLSMVSTAMRNFAEVASRLRGRDANSNGNTTNVNLFMLSSAPTRAEKPAEKVVSTPALQSSAQNAQVVIETGAAPAQKLDDVATS